MSNHSVKSHPTLYIKIALEIMFTLMCFFSNAQDGIGIGTDNVNEDAVLEIDSKTDGLLIPRMTSTERLAIGASSKGLIVYDTSKEAFYYFDGTNWLRLIVNPGQINLNMDNHRITNLADGSSAQDAINKRQFDTKLSLAGGAMTGNLAMNDHKITRVSNGTNSGDAVNQGQLNTKLSLSGGTMTGNIAMNNRKITGLANGTATSDAVNNEQLSQLESKIGKLHTGECWIGDVGDDSQRTCSFGKNIGTSNYVVVGSLRVRPEDVSGVWGNDDVTWTVFNETATSFKISLDENHSDVQKLYLRYVIFAL